MSGGIRSPVEGRPATRPGDAADVAAAWRDASHSLDEHALTEIAERLADRRMVLLGEATHGTHEFYRLRADLTARLVGDHGFSFVAVEGDWTDCYDATRFVQGRGDADTAREAAAAFDRWPTWMWANWEVVAFLSWLRETNEGRDDPAGFFGLDVYGLHESMAAVLDYLEDYDPAAAERARDAYACFEPYGDDAREYARSTRLVPEDCEDEVVSVLADLEARQDRYGGDHPLDAFAAEQNVLVARNAEAYYRALVDADTDSWNVRDEHMADTLDRLLDHHDERADDQSAGGDGDDRAQAVVWAHNTHVGDARATDMERRGERNLGQLARERHGRGDVALVGFGTHRGSVIAADEWGADRERMRLPDDREGSVEAALHRVGGDRYAFTADADDRLAAPLGHRTVGVVYHPERELGNYVPTVLADRYDAFLHVDETEALHPLDVPADQSEMPESYPWGL